MDEALEALRRAVRADPGDLGAALRLASACERLNLFHEAWEVLVRRLSGALDSEGDEPVLRGLADLAARRPGPLLGYLGGLASLDEVRFSLRAIARSGEWPVLIVLGCESGRARGGEVLAQRLLRKALAAEIVGLPGAFVLSAALGGDGALARLMPVLRAMTDLEPDEVCAEFGMLLTDEGRAAYQQLWRAQGLDIARAFAFVRENVLTPRSAEDWHSIARDLIARARTGRLELLPWLVGIGTADDTALAADAVAAFQELTGRLAPPLDVDDLAARWRERRSR